MFLNDPSSVVLVSFVSTGKTPSLPLMPTQKLPAVSKVCLAVRTRKSLVLSGTSWSWLPGKSFFSTSVRGNDGWYYVLGDFAEMVHPVVDSVQLTIKRIGSDTEENITVGVVPYWAVSSWFAGLGTLSLEIQQKRRLQPTEWLPK